MAGGPSAPERLTQVRNWADEAGLRGWVRAADVGGLSVHAEGPSGGLDRLLAWLAESVGGEAVKAQAARVEGHEQFAVRGQPAGVFVVQEHQAQAHQFELRLEVDGVMRSWAIPRGPSMDPAAKRLAVGVEDHELEQNESEGRTEAGAAIVWDRGLYEQGGRVPWPQALERGHAVFVLRGEKLSGGFALQRTRRGGQQGSHWLLIKRRDEQARPGSNVVGESPRSVLSARALADVIET
jgi:DNA ligase D-like protein (predicted 3'-phosphoesterase)